MRDFALHNPAKGVPMFKLGEHEQWSESMVDLLPAEGSALVCRFAQITLYTGQRIVCA